MCGDVISDSTYQVECCLSGTQLSLKEFLDSIVCND